MYRQRNRFSTVTLRRDSTALLYRKTSVSTSLGSNPSITTEDRTENYDLRKRKSLSASIRSLFPTRSSGAPTPSTTRENSVDEESRHPLTTIAAEPIPHAVELPGKTAVSEVSGAVPATQEGQPQVYPASHGKFQEEIVRSQPQEIHSFGAEVMREKEKNESRFHIRSKASLAWTVLKTRAKFYRATRI